MTAVDLENVSLIRDGHALVDGVTWTVAAGEHWAIIGANGCGKTTLMKIVSGWQFPSRGRATVLGQRFGSCEMAALRRRIGWVSHALEGSLRPRLMAVGVVLTGLDATLGIRRDPGEADLGEARRLLDTVGLADAADRPFALLSQGERTRVMIARTLISRPALMVLDEPCVGLDPFAREVFLHTVDTLARSPDAPTILYVTHHIDEITPTFGRVLAMRAGRAVASGSRERVLQPGVLEAAFGCPFTVVPDGDARFRAYPRPQGAARFSP